MFVGCSVEHIVWAIFVEKHIHTGLTANTGHNGLTLNVGKFLGHHQANIVLRRFSLINQYHRRRFESCHLTHYLGTYRACRACYQHTFACQQFTHRLQVDLDFLTRQQVFHLHLLQMHLGRVRLSQLPILYLNLLGLLNKINLTASTYQHVLYGLVVTELFYTERTHQYRLDMQFLDDFRQVLVRIIDILA